MFASIIGSESHKRLKCLKFFHSLSMKHLEYNSLSNIICILIIFDTLL